MLKNSIVWFVFLIFILGCKQTVKNTTTLVLRIEAPAKGKIYLQKVVFMGDQNTVIDSTENDFIRTHIFNIKKDPSLLYQLKVPYCRKQIFFIADADTIHISVDISQNSYKVNGSKATNIYYQYLKDLENANSNKNLANLQIIPNQNITDKLFTLPFIDTVSNPAVFMLAYNTIEFGKDYTLLKEVVDKAAIRFPEVSYIKQLKIDTYRMLDIFEKEYNVNDSLPSFSLPNIDSVLFSTASLKGKYYLINFWSSWCEPCFYFMESMKHTYTAMDTNKIIYISIAIDNNKTTWKKIIAQHKYNWINLIDEKMWNGEAVNTLKFDSIPFNFLVSPDGRVLAKAIKPDSLKIVLMKFKLIK